MTISKMGRKDGHGRGQKLVEVLRIKKWLLSFASP